MLTTILLIALVCFGGLVAIIAFQPDDFVITRTAAIPAPASVLFDYVNDFHKWETWSPWAELDPKAKNSYSGASFGEGAIFTWAGNSKVGEGKMTLLESRQNQLIRIKLEFLKPFKAVHRTEFTFSPGGEITTVTWTMSGKNNFMAKAFTMVMNCDKMIGGQFEKGLNNLKNAAVGKRSVAA